MTTEKSFKRQSKGLIGPYPDVVKGCFVGDIIQKKKSCGDRGTHMSF